MPDVATTLTRDERALLARLEARVDQGLRACEDVVRDLLEIHRRRLYRETHPETAGGFRAYCAARWPQYSANYIYRLLRLGEVRENVLPVGNTEDYPLPNERQSRELVPLTPEEQRLVWEEVTDGGTTVPTVREVREAVEEALTVGLDDEPTVEEVQEEERRLLEEREERRWQEAVGRVERHLVRAERDTRLLGPDGRLVATAIAVAISRLKGLE